MLDNPANAPNNSNSIEHLHLRPHKSQNEASKASNLQLYQQSIERGTMNNQNNLSGLQTQKNKAGQLTNNTFLKDYSNQVEEL